MKTRVEKLKEKKLLVQIGRKLFELKHFRSFKVPELSNLLDKYDVRLLKTRKECE